MAKDDSPRARSLYRGLRMTLTQAPGDSPSVLTLSVKHESGRWDEWNLLFPAIRVAHQPLEGYRDVLTVAVRAVEALLEAEERSR